MLYMIYMVKNGQEMKGQLKMAKKKQTRAVAVQRDSQVANELSSQYGIVAAKGDEFMREAVRFGTMLIEWGEFLGEARGGAGGGASGGLKGWLAKHCPEINYKTAMRFKYMAKGAVKKLGGGAMAIAALLGRSEIATPDGDVIDVESKVVEEVDEMFAKASSLRKFEQMYFEFSAGKGRAGRPKGTKAAAGAPLTKVESARRLWADLVYQAVKHRAGLYSAAKLLPREDAEKSNEELKQLCDALKASLDEKD